MAAPYWVEYELRSKPQSEEEDDSDDDSDCVCQFSPMQDSSKAEAASQIDDNAVKWNHRTAANLTKFLNQLSIDERNKAYEDIHGAAKCITETPELLKSRLDDMQLALDKQLQKLSQSEGGRNAVETYQLALRNNRSHVEDPKFRLAFLRSVRFDANKAAERYLNYFVLVKGMFGDHRVGHPITMADLGPEEIAEMKQGHAQILPQRDSAGRAVMLVDPIPLMAIYAENDGAQALAAVSSKQKTKLFLSHYFPLFCTNQTIPLRHTC